MTAEAPHPGLCACGGEVSEEVDPSTLLTFPVRFRGSCDSCGTVSFREGEPDHVF